MTTENIPIYLMHTGTESDRMYQCIYKPNQMCLCSCTSFTRLERAIKSLYFKAHGDLNNYLEESMYSMEYNPIPPKVTMESRKESQAHFEQLYNESLYAILNAAENDFLSTQKSKTIKLLPKAKKSAIKSNMTLKKTMQTNKTAKNSSNDSKPSNKSINTHADKSYSTTNQTINKSSNKPLNDSLSIHKKTSSRMTNSPKEMPKKTAKSAKNNRVKKRIKH